MTDDTPTPGGPSGAHQTGAPGPSGMQAGPGAPSSGPGASAAGPGRSDGEGEGGAAQGAHAARGPMRRDTQHKIIAGVCSGLGRYFNLDPVIFRVVLAALTLSGGLGLLLYSLGWLLMPVDEDGRSELQRMLGRRFDASSGQALLAVLIGAGVFLSFFGNGPGFFPWLLMAMLIGAVAWAGKHRPGPADTPPEGGDSGVPAEPAAPLPAEGPTWWQRNAPLTRHYVKPTGPGGSCGSAGAEPPAGPRPTYLWGPAEDDAAAEEPPPHRRRTGRDRARPYQRERSLLGKSVVFTALAAGAATTLGLGSGRSHHSVQALEFGLVVAVGLLGLGLILGAWFGRVRTGAVVWAGLLTLCLAGVSSLPDSVDSSIGRRHWTPASAAEVRPVYRLGGGYGTLDLTAVDPHGSSIPIRAELGAGELAVRVPSNVALRVDGHADLGSVRLPGPHQGDIKVANRNHESVVLPAQGRSRGTLRLDLDVGVGDLAVYRVAPGSSGTSGVTPARPSPPAPPSPPSLPDRSSSR